MKTISFALAAIQRIEVAKQTSEWWESQSDSFKEQYIKDHPRSKFAREARALEDKEGKHAKKYSEVFDKDFYTAKKPSPKDKEAPKKSPPKSLMPTAVKALDYASEEFFKQATSSINRFLNVDTFDLTPLHVKSLKLLDSAISKKLQVYAKQKAQIRKQQKVLQSKLKKATTKEEKAAVKREISKLETSHNRITRQEQGLTKSHAALVEKHPGVLKNVNTIRKQRKARAEKKSNEAKINKEITKLKSSLAKVQKAMEASTDSKERRQYRAKIREIKAEIVLKTKELKSNSKVNP